MKFTAKSASIWLKAKELASNETMFSITDARKMKKQNFKNADQIDDVIVFELELEDGTAGKVELYSTQARLNMFEMVMEAKKANDVVEDVYFVVDAYEVTPARLNKQKKVIKEAVMREYIRFYDAPQSAFDEQKEEEEDLHDENGAE